MTNVEKQLPIKDFKEIRSGAMDVPVFSGEITKISVTFDKSLSKTPDIIFLSPEVNASIGKVYFESWNWTEVGFELIATYQNPGLSSFYVHYLAVVF